MPNISAYEKNTISLRAKFLKLAWEKGTSLRGRLIKKKPLKITARITSKTRDSKHNTHKTLG